MAVRVAGQLQGCGCRQHWDCGTAICENGITSASRAPRTSCFLLAVICGIHTPQRPCQFPHRRLHASAASGGWAMTFEEILDQATAMLQRRGRLTYGTLKRQFQLDDLQNELIMGQRLARDEDGAVLVWTGAAVPPPAPAPTPPPLAYTPPYLVEKILTTRSALEGERKQVTVLLLTSKAPRR